MTDDPRVGSNGQGYGLIGVLDRLRDDFREDLAALEGRLMVAIADNRRALTDYATTHSNEHSALRHERDVNLADANDAHARYDAFIESSKLVQARKDGALGITRYVVELVSNNAPALIKIVAAVATALLAVSGNVHVDIGN